MDTKKIPAIIMLTAGLIDAVISIIYQTDLLSFTKRLLFVLVIFYILGIGVKIILDINFPIMTDEENDQLEDKEEDGQEEMENIVTDESESDSNSPQQTVEEEQ